MQSQALCLQMPRVEPHTDMNPMHKTTARDKTTEEWHTMRQRVSPAWSMLKHSAARPSQSATVRKVWPLPVDHPHSVQVLHGRDKLPDVSAGFRLLQPLLLVYLVHQIAPGTQLHDQVVAVVRL